ncbi:AfsA-related hotdog domain-containing protein, partial [Streptomyces sp. Act-28]
LGVVYMRQRRDVGVDAADPRHPFFFDHATDHVPGMVLLEAARQAAALASGGTLLRMTGARLTALRFTEFAPAARVTCVPHRRTCVFRFDQGGECRAFGVLHYRSLSRV